MTRIEQIGEAGVLKLKLESLLRSGKSLDEAVAELGGFVLPIKPNSVEDAAKQAERMAEQMRRAQ